MQVCFFEDDQVKYFYPLALSRPIDDLRLGILTIREKWIRRLKLNSWIRTERVPVNYVFPTGNLESKDDVYWINSRLLPDQSLIEEIKSLGVSEGLVLDKEPVVFRLSYEKHLELLAANTNTPQGVSWRQSTGTILEQIWNLYEYNGKQIEADTELLTQTNEISPYTPEHAITIGEMQLFAAESVTVDPGVIIDARKGPVVLGKNTHIMSGSVIQGPVSIGDNSVVKVGSKIYPDTTIGPVCKVAGEIQNCIFQGYSNKAHDGFAGNSLFGEWVNLGADTNTSNLKNNYSDIILKDWEEGSDLESGVQFCGTIMGDHSKTAINTMLNTGTQCGVASNIFTSTFPPKFIPSFSWVGDGALVDHIFDKAMDTASRMMKRRGITPDENYRSMMRYIFEHR